MGHCLRHTLWIALSAVLFVGDLSSGAPRRRTYDFMGVIERVDSAARTIVVRIGSKKNAERETVRYDVDTEIIRAKKPANADSMRPELRIWVYLREDSKGRSTDLARRLTLADPYPDITGTITGVDVKAGSIQISRQYPGGKSGDRPQTLTVRVSRDTVIMMEKRAIKLEDIPVGRRCQITSVRGADNNPTGVAAKITVWKATSPGARSGPWKPPADEVPETDGD